MITDETMKEKILEEKKALFFRLYFIPWIILTILLMTIIGYLTINKNKINNAPIIAPEILINDTNDINEIKRGYYKEAVKAGYGEWICDKEGEVSFKWKACTESLITSQVQMRVNSKLKILQDTYKTNATEIMEGVKKRAYTESIKEMQIEAVKRGMGKWESEDTGESKFKWKTIPEIVMIYTSTESNELNKAYMVKRELPFTMDNYRIAKGVGMDIEGEIIKRVIISIESAFWGNRDNELKEKVKGEVSRSIHGMFDGFETLNKTDKQYKIK